jgi:hypothetical protein
MSFKGKNMKRPKKKKDGKCKGKSRKNKRKRGYRS